jgi:alpha-tubulin suppressor-like RCC1 family protein
MRSLLFMMGTLALIACQQQTPNTGSADAGEPADAGRSAECTVTEITSGSGHACARRADGSVVCWGNFLRVGFCAPSGTGAAATVEGLAPVTALSAQYAHTCAVGDAGSLHCWGWNAHAQLGAGKNSDYVVLPAEVVDAEANAFRDVDQVAAGGGHTCARRQGTVWCWGNNNSGQLGIKGADPSVPHPVKLAGLDDVSDVRAGNSHSCAITADRMLWCWGWNGLGQVGVGTQDDVLEPTSVLADVRAVATGIEHTCAIDGDGRIWCWGNNGSGQLGDGTTTMRTSPVQIEAPFVARAIAVGAHHSCALDDADALWCWGANWVGQLGLGWMGDGVVAVPTAATAVDAPVSSVALGEAHTCAVTKSGAARCWGSNDEGELGDGQRVMGGVVSPVDVAACPAAEPPPIDECEWIPYPDPA